MSTPVLDFDPARRTNAQAIADLARLGFLRAEDHVLDTTVGPEAGFWKQWSPGMGGGGKLTTNDVDPNVKAKHHYDARSLPFQDRWFDVVVFDPPYANRGTATNQGGIDERFGTTTYRTRRDVEKLLVDGTVEALRVADRLAIVKCQDANVASRYAPQTYLVWEAAKKVGARLVGELHVIGRREQPTGKKQLNIWSGCSTMLVLQRGKK